jgi:hypothetical protein
MPIAPPIKRGFIMGKASADTMAIIWDKFGKEKAEDKAPAQENNGEKPSSSDQPGKAAEGLYVRPTKAVETKAE